jgi:hypothetical protein
LQSPAVAVVKGVVQEKDETHFQADAEQLTPKLGKGMRPQAAGQETAQVFAAQVDFHRTGPVQGKGQVSNRAELMADGAATIFGPRDERVRFPHGQGFQAMRAKRLAGNVIPRALACPATAARIQGQHIVRGSKAYAGHGWFP